MGFRIIKSPSKGCLDIIRRRISKDVDINDVDAVALVQGKLLDMIYIARYRRKNIRCICNGYKRNLPSTYGCPWNIW